MTEQKTDQKVSIEINADQFKSGKAELERMNKVLAATKQPYYPAITQDKTACKFDGKYRKPILNLLKESTTTNAEDEAKRMVAVNGWNMVAYNQGKSVVQITLPHELEPGIYDIAKDWLVLSNLKEGHPYFDALQPDEAMQDNGLSTELNLPTMDNWLCRAVQVACMTEQYFIDLNENAKLLTAFGVVANSMKVMVSGKYETDLNKGFPKIVKLHATDGIMTIQAFIMAFDPAPEVLV